MGMSSFVIFRLNKTLFVDFVLVSSGKKWLDSGVYHLEWYII